MLEATQFVVICYGSPRNESTWGLPDPAAHWSKSGSPWGAQASCPVHTSRLRWGFPRGTPAPPYLADACPATHLWLLPACYQEQEGMSVGDQSGSDMRGPRWPHQPHGPQRRLQESRSRTWSRLAELTVNPGAVTSAPQLTGQPCKGRALLGFQGLALLLEGGRCSKVYDE